MMEDEDDDWDANDYDYNGVEYVGMVYLANATYGGCDVGARLCVCWWQKRPQQI